MIIHHGGKEITFDTSKIAEAIVIAKDTFFNGFIAIIREFIGRICIIIKRNFDRFIHGICLIQDKIKLALKRNPILAVLVVAMESCIKLLVLASEAVACRIRTSYLQRTQDRGSCDSNDEIVFLSAAV